MPNLCVFCASSNSIRSEFFDAARTLGSLMAERGHALVYGGGNVGLMGALATSMREGGGRITGVIPEALRDRELAYEGADEMIVTRDLRERKAVMESRSDGFLALPGGFGTLEEVVEVLTLRQLGFHDKPVVFLDVDGYFESLFAHFDRVFDERFAPQDRTNLYRVAGAPAEVLDLMESLL